MKTAAHMIWTTYRQSLRNLWSLRALWIILADSAFYLLLIIITKFATAFATGFTSGVTAGISRDVAEAFLVKIILTLVIAGVAIWVSWTMTRAIVWQLLAWAQFTPKTWARFFGFNAIWTLVIALPVLLLARRILALMQSGMAISPTFLYINYALIFVLAYFGYNVFYAFVKEQRIFAAYKKGFLRAFCDAAYLVPAFIVLVATMWLLGQLNRFIALLPEDAGLAVSSVVLFGSLTWAKMYFYDVLEKGAREQKKEHAMVKKPTEKKPGRAPAPKRQKKQAKGSPG